MSGDYPTGEELVRVETWPLDNPLGWFAYIKSIGHWWLQQPEPSGWFGWHESDGQDYIGKAVRVFNVSTGGWSGNEEIISAMEERTLLPMDLWTTTWHSTTRGGHYVFMVRK